jgi:DNA transformation protein and related proteins
VTRRVVDLPNLGPRTARLLADIGIRTEDDLRGVGAVEAFVRLRFETGERVSMNLLWALYGALAGVDWRRIDPAVKQELARKIGAKG